MLTFENNELFIMILGIVKILTKQMEKSDEV